MTRRPFLPPQARPYRPLVTGFSPPRMERTPSPFTRSIEDEIAVVLTDMMMPVMDGEAMVHVLRRIDSTVKIIAASGLNVIGGMDKLSGGEIKHFLRSLIRQRLCSRLYERSWRNRVLAVRQRPFRLKCLIKCPVLNRQNLDGSWRR